MYRIEMKTTREGWVVGAFLSCLLSCSLSLTLSPFFRRTRDDDDGCCLTINLSTQRSSHPGESTNYNSTSVSLSLSPLSLSLSASPNTHKPRLPSAPICMETAAVLLDAFRKGFQPSPRVEFKLRLFFLVYIRVRFAIY